MFSSLSCEVLKLIRKWRQNVHPLGEESASMCGCRTWLPVGMQLLRQLFNCLPDLKGHCRVANIFHNSISLLLRTTTVHFIEPQQCAKRDRFTAQQVRNLGSTFILILLLIFIKRTNGLPKEAFMKKHCYILTICWNSSKLTWENGISLKEKLKILEISKEKGEV